MRRHVQPLLAAAGAAVLLAVAPAAQAVRADQLTMNVSFTYTGQITMTLPNGTPVGTTSGPPTVVPAGYYSLLLAGPGGCTLTPYFVLKGPGVTVTDNMAQGEDEFTEHDVNFLPNSTYTWHNSDSPNVVYTFTTSSDVVGTKAPPVVWNGPTSGKKQSNADIVGSGRGIFRGTLTGTVGAGGQLTLTFKGSKPATLKAGRYSLVVTDKSPTNGLTVGRGAAKPVTVTTVPFVGRHKATVTLSTGRWLFTTTRAKKVQSVLVG
jgi:hypothetical protein